LPLGDAEPMGRRAHAQLRTAGRGFGVNPCDGVSSAAEWRYAARDPRARFANEPVGVGWQHGRIPRAVDLECRAVRAELRISAGALLPHTAEQLPYNTAGRRAEPLYASAKPGGWAV